MFNPVIKPKIAKGFNFSRMSGRNLIRVEDPLVGFDIKHTGVRPFASKFANASGDLLTLRRLLTDTNADPVSMFQKQITHSEPGEFFDFKCYGVVFRGLRFVVVTETKQTFKDKSDEAVPYCSIPGIKPYGISVQSNTRCWYPDNQLYRNMITEFKLGYL